jgi:hypothetical protein
MDVCCVVFFFGWPLKLDGDLEGGGFTVQGARWGRSRGYPAFALLMCAVLVLGR